MSNDEAPKSPTSRAALFRNEGRADNIDVLQSSALNGADLVVNEQSGVMAGLTIDGSLVDSGIDAESFLADLRAALKDVPPETAERFIAEAKNATSSDDTVKRSALKSVCWFAKDVFTGIVAESVSHLVAKYLGVDPRTS